MKPLTIKLAEGERVIAVVPERCSGPGWSNQPVWVYIESNDQKLRTECIQPEERTPEMHTLFSSGVAMCNALIAAVPVKNRGHGDLGYSNREAAKYVSRALRGEKLPPWEEV